MKAIPKKHADGNGGRSTKEEMRSLIETVKPNALRDRMLRVLAKL